VTVDKDARRVRSRPRHQTRGEAARRRDPIVTVDGPAGAGKSTAARGLAAALGYAYIDSGAMYRVVALAAQRAGVDLDDGEAVAALVSHVRFVVEARAMRVLLDGEDVTIALRAPEVGGVASRVAAHARVRARLVEEQRMLGGAGGIVMDGRDIGTVVFPDADCKFFLTASAAERARRRHAEDAAGGGTVELATTRAEIEARDRRDRERAVAPLRAADDAIVIDTSALTPEAVIGRMLEGLRARARP